MIVGPFAREVKRLRSERGLTIRDLASALGKSVDYLAKIEVQGEIPTPELTCEIARLLEASPIVLLRLAKEARIYRSPTARSAASRANVVGAELWTPVPFGGQPGDSFGHFLRSVVRLAFFVDVDGVSKPAAASEALASASAQAPG